MNRIGGNHSGQTGRKKTIQASSWNIRDAVDTAGGRSVRRCRSALFFRVPVRAIANHAMSSLLLIYLLPLLLIWLFFLGRRRRFEHASRAALAEARSSG
ncbi:MAG: hypothetical protein OEX15_07020, partial [Gammaproteobacteria bacterium]|nr:hypothetical protein [Gammaproteobacteria bacterium]